MKRTKRGSDLLKATLAGTLIATIVNVQIVLALCLAVVLGALIGGVILASSSGQYIVIRPESTRISCFKGEEIRTRLLVQSKWRRFVSLSLSRIQPSKGVDGKIEQSNGDGFTVLMKPRFAGRFYGISATFELNDPLRLFSKSIDFSEREFVVDCYPSSILNETQQMRPVSISLGERETTGQGIGVEFYSADEYSSAVETKNIFWKRVASLPDERLLVKKRASNIQKTITISLLSTNERRENHLQWIDSACEGVATIGRTILSIGCNVKLIFDRDGHVVSKDAASLTELSDAIMEMSTAGISNLDNASFLLSKADICVIGFEESRNNLLAAVVARKPTLLIEDTCEIPPHIGELAVVYHPHRDLGGLVRRVAGN